MPIQAVNQGWVIETELSAYALGINAAGRLAHAYWEARVPGWPGCTRRCHCTSPISRAPSAGSVSLVRKRSAEIGQASNLRTAERSK